MTLFLCCGGGEAVNSLSTPVLQTKAGTGPGHKGFLVQAEEATQHPTPLPKAPEAKLPS